VAGALSGFRVIETGDGLACAIAGMLMADFGADVIRLESKLEGKPAGKGPGKRNPGFAMWHRNKRLISPGAPGESEPGEPGFLDRLLASADVCIVGPGADVSEGGLSTRAGEHPQVVFLVMPPYHGDPPWPGQAASSELIAAAMGLAMRQSSNEDGPVHSVYPHVSYVHGAWAAACAVAALVEREKSASGQVVTVTGAHGALLTGTATFVLDPDAPTLVRPAGPGGPHPLYTTYQCEDGRWLFLGALTAKFQQRATEVLGLAELRCDERLGGTLDRAVLPENRDWVRARMARRFRCRPRADWLDLLEKADCPAGPVLERDQWLDSPQVRAIGMRIALPAPAPGEAAVEAAAEAAGEVVMPGIPLTLTKSPGHVRGFGRPIAEADYAPGRPARPDAAVSERAIGAPGKGPLAGVRILDLGTVLAGPLSGCLLSELGADVIKVEPLTGDPFRVRGFVYNRGMRSIALDLRSDSGKDAFHRLVARSDVVLDNFRPGVLRRLGIDYDSLSTVNPGIVCFSLTGFGDRGPLRDRPGFDPILQAMSGMMSAQGGQSDPVFFTVAVNDIAGAVMGALAVCLGLLHRSRTGEGQPIHSSLAAMSVFMQSGELLRFEGRDPAQVGAADFLGPSPLGRYYRAHDGWVRVEASDEAADSRAVAVALGADPGNSGLFTGALSSRAAATPAAELIAWLASLGVPATTARRPEDLPRDDALMSREAFHQHRRADGRPFLTPGRLAQFSRTQETRQLQPPGLGEHTRVLLREAGLPDSAIDALTDEGVVVRGTPFAVEELVAYR
jgi:crotonobetainyl-CoA:carnitine CoA-transferase CaiB-like acyl-CoA transferase